MSGLFYQLVSVLWNDTICSFSTLKKRRTTRIRRVYSQTVYLLGLVGRKLILNLQGDGGRNRRGGRRWSQQWSKHSSRQRDIQVKCYSLKLELPFNVLSSCVKCQMSPFMIIHSVCSVWFFRTWNPDAHWLWNLFPWTLFWVQLHHSGSSPFSLCILPWAYFFGWGQTHQCRHFPLLCDFMYICLRLCLQVDRGIFGFF